MAVKIHMDLSTGETVRLYWLEQINLLRQQSGQIDLKADPLDPEQVEIVHDLRVTVRRLTSVASGFRPYLHGEIPEQIHDLLAPGQKLTGTLRDLDVWTAGLVKLPSELLEENLRQDLLRTAGQKILKKRKSLREYLTDKSFVKKTGSLVAALTVPAAGIRLSCTALTGKGTVRMYLLEDIAAAVLSRQAAQITVYHHVLPALDQMAAWRQQPAALSQPVQPELPFEPAQLLDQYSTDILHQLRLSMKDFRYVLELLAPALRPPARQLLQVLKRYQDQLGAWHDAMCAGEILNKMHIPDSKLSDLFRYYDEKRKQALLEFLTGWPELDPAWFAARILPCLVSPVVTKQDIRS